jgi:hypothetical protein
LDSVLTESLKRRRETFELAVRADIKNALEVQAVREPLSQLPWLSSPTGFVFDHFDDTLSPLCWHFSEISVHVQARGSKSDVSHIDKLVVEHRVPLEDPIRIADFEYSGTEQANFTDALEDFLLEDTDWLMDQLEYDNVDAWTGNVLLRSFALKRAEFKHIWDHKMVWASLQRIQPPADWTVQEVEVEFCVTCPKEESQPKRVVSVEFVDSDLDYGKFLPIVTEALEIYSGIDEGAVFDARVNLYRQSCTVYVYTYKEES